ncbi:hypothetical protein QTP88_004333 [Uroleucon formosanum]
MLILKQTRLLDWQRVFALPEQDKYPVVETKSGPISGKQSKTWKGRTIYSFQGIPYATPPVGNLRFQEAQPIDPWLKVWNASSPGSKCLQYNHWTYLIEGDEDCLYVNIHTPKLPGRGKSIKPLNVLVYIHGGAFMFFEASVYQPDYILDKDIIPVTINYQLGPLSFFSTGDSVVPGNNGLKDQVQALKWVKRNIKYFGGDPESITITGMSAGGASVHFHMLSPLSRGLFQKVFSQSGTALCPWTIAENVPDKSAAVGAYLGCPTRPSKDLIECLMTKPAVHIVEAVKIFLPFLYNPFSPFGPIVELPSENAFISELPYNIIAEGLATDVPVLFSFVTHEGLYPGSEFINNPELLKYIDENWNKVMPHILDYNYTIPQDYIDTVSEMIREEYIGSNYLAKGNTEEFIQMIGDRLFVVDIIKAAKMHAKFYNSPVYLYQFGYRGRHSFSEHFAQSNENYGASHTDDMAYALKNEFVNVEDSESDKSLVPIIVDIWTSFAFEGIPSTGDSRINWTPVSQSLDDSVVSFLKISSPTNITMSEVEDMGRTSFWDSLDFKENEYYSYPEHKYE